METLTLHPQHLIIHGLDLLFCRLCRLNFKHIKKCLKPCVVTSKRKFCIQSKANNLTSYFGSNLTKQNQSNGIK